MSSIQSHKETHDTEILINMEENREFNLKTRSYKSINGTTFYKYNYDIYDEHLYEATPYSGVYHQFYRNGTYSTYCEHTNGKCHGHVFDWYFNGQLKSHTKYHNGDECGPYYRWNKNGKFVQKNMTHF